MDIAHFVSVMEGKTCATNIGTSVKYLSYNAVHIIELASFVLAVNGD